MARKNATHKHKHRERERERNGESFVVGHKFSSWNKRRKRSAFAGWMGSTIVI